MATPTSRADAPQRSPRKGGLSAVTGPYRTNERLGVGGTVLFDPEQCGFTFGEVAMCYSTDTTQDEMVGSAPANGASIGENFGGYTGVECYLNGNVQEYAPLAQAQLIAGQDRFIEARLGTWLEASTATAAGATLFDAIALADARGDLDYIGLPVVHVNRGDAVRAVAEGSLIAGAPGSGELWTPNGTPVVASVAYAASRVYVSGSIAVEHSSIGVFPGQDLTHNTTLAIAERVYSLLVDCEYRYKFTVTP